MTAIYQMLLFGIIVISVVASVKQRQCLQTEDAAATVVFADAFVVPSVRATGSLTSMTVSNDRIMSRYHHSQQQQRIRRRSLDGDVPRISESSLWESPTNNDSLSKSISATTTTSTTTPLDNLNVNDDDIDIGDDDDDDSDKGKAVTNTINERLLAELQEAQDKEKYGARSTTGKRLGLVDGYGRTRKTDEEIQAAIAEARDLNGVNPLVALTGGIFALVVAGVLWYSTGSLGSWFATHPPQTDVYFIQRAAQVVRNIAMGMISLASGFFGVTGIGIFFLGVRVAYGVMTGELDPTPIKPSAAAAAAAKEKQDAVDFGRMMDLMMNKKPNRRNKQ